jgi:predicted dehydrogenase
MHSYTVGIIGAGSIGALKPNHIDEKYTPLPLTHAHAIFSDPRFNIAWIRDTCEEKEKQAIQKWQVDNKNKNDIVPDVIVIAPPTETHLETIKNITETKPLPSLIILEKPAGMNIHECTKIDYLTNQAGIRVIVNYGREYCSTITKAIETIKKEDVQQIVFYYTRGLIRDGSHAIDILNRFGEIIDAKIADSIGDPLYDYSKEDPTFELVANYSSFTARLIPLDGRKYDIFEMHVLTKKARWIFDDHFKMVCRQYALEEDTYGDYFSMPGISSQKRQYKKTNLEWSLKYLYNDAYRTLEDKTHQPKCTIKNAQRVHAVLNKAFIDFNIRKNQQEK